MSFIILLLVTMITLLMIVESFVPSSIKLPLRTLERRQSLYSSDSSKSSAEVVEQRKVEINDDISRDTRDGKYRRNSLGHGSDERSLVNEGSCDLSNIVISFQQSDLLMSLTNDMSNLDKLARISIATKDGLLSGIIMNDNTPDAFHLQAAGLFEKYWDDGDF